MVTEKTIARLLDNFEREGVDHLSALLDEPAMRTQIARSINDAVVTFLQRPLSEHLERLGPERIAGLQQTTARYITAALRDPTTRQHAIEQLDRALEAFVIQGAAAIVVQVDRVVVVVPVAGGWPGAHRLPAEQVDRLVAELSPALWRWIEQQVPEIVSRVDVQSMVEDKVLGFSLQRIEEIVRATSQRELDIIIRLGYVLGAVVGALAYSVSLFLP